MKVKDELSRTKADNRKLERELLETIQKKIKLSQQVEQWQVITLLITYLPTALVVKKNLSGNPEKYPDDQDYFWKFYLY